VLFQKSRILDTFDERPPPPHAWRYRTRWFPGFLILLLAVFMAFFEQYFLPIQLPLVGKPSLQAIRAPYEFVFDEQKAVQRFVEQQLRDFVPVFVYDAETTRQIPLQWESFFNGLEECRRSGERGRKGAVDCMRQQFHPAPSDKILGELLGYPHTDKMYSMLLTSLKEQLSRGILDDREIRTPSATLRIQASETDQVEQRKLSDLALLSQAEKVLRDNLELINISPELRSALFQQLNGTLKSNLLYAEKNEEMLASIRGRVSDRQKILFRRGDLLVRRGQIVTLLDYYRVKDCLDTPRPDPLWVGTASFFPFFLITFLFVLISNRFQGWATPSPSKSYLLIFTVLLAVLLPAKVLYLFTNLRGVAIPVEAAGIVVTLLLNPAAGVMTAFLASVYATFLTNLDMGLFLYYLMGSLLLVLSTARAKRRGTLFIYSGLVGGVNVLLLVCMMLLKGRMPDELILSDLALQAFLSAPGSWLLALLITPLGEKLFRLTTADRLRALSDLNHPLLKKLQEKAPGTYYHSLAVANLACVAAEAVKANVPLVRAGAYYHDIGKLVQPDYFIENQKNRENPHDTMDPRISYEIVKAHVVDGVDIARDYGFPDIVTDLIAEHHGTTVVEAFYGKAQKNPTTVHWSRDFFRYDGPTPGSVEAAILMISDVVEAMFRVLKNTNPLEVRQKVHGFIVRKFEDGQFDHCALTTSTLARIETAMIQALLGILHKRIEYPENDTGEGKSSIA
jgi:cyclic-di-AMP phosphodiesterase PgpH